MRLLITNFLALTQIFLQLTHANYLRADPHHPLAHIPLLGRAVIETCPIGQVKCTDGRGSCCPLDAECTVTRGNIPICAVADCSGEVCSGVLDGLCCSAGFTCNEASTRCVSTAFGFGGGRQTGGQASIQTTEPTSQRVETTPTQPVTILNIPTLTGLPGVPPPRLPAPLTQPTVISFPTTFNFPFESESTGRKVSFSDLSGGVASLPSSTTSTTTPTSTTGTSTTTSESSSSTESAAATTSGEGATSADSSTSASASPTGGATVMVVDFKIMIGMVVGVSLIPLGF